MLILLLKAEEPRWKCQDHLLFVLYSVYRFFSTPIRTKCAGAIHSFFGTLLVNLSQPYEYFTFITLHP